MQLTLLNTTPSSGEKTNYLGEFIFFTHTQLRQCFLVLFKRTMFLKYVIEPPWKVTETICVCEV